MTHQLEWLKLPVFFIIFTNSYGCLNCVIVQTSSSFIVYTKNIISLISLTHNYIYSYLVIAQKCPMNILGGPERPGLLNGDLSRPNFHNLSH